MNRSSIISILLAATVIAGLASCDTAIEPFVGTDQPYTIWGYFDAMADTQRVRVIQLPGTLEECQTAPIDARVYSTDLDTGEKREWIDALIAFDDGSCGHVFWSPFRAEFGHSYTLNVERSDGETTSVTGTIPERVILERPEFGSTSTVPSLRIIGEVDRIVRAQVVYEALSVPPANPWPVGTPIPQVYSLKTRVPYDGEEEETGEGWRLKINLRSDKEAVVKTFQAHCLSSLQIVLRSVEVSVLIADPAWIPPDGSFDPEELVEPGVFSNVENGYGFFGAGYALSTRWTPAYALQQSLGYRMAPACGMMARDTPACYVYEWCE